MFLHMNFYKFVQGKKKFKKAKMIFLYNFQRTKELIKSSKLLHFSASRKILSFTVLLNRYFYNTEL